MIRCDLVCDTCGSRAAQEEVAKADPKWLGLKSSDIEQHLHFCPTCAVRIRHVLSLELARYGNGRKETKH